VDMGKSQKNNKKEYRVLNGSLDLIEYYQIFGCSLHGGHRLLYMAAGGVGGGGKTGSSARCGPGPTAQAARGCPWARPVGQGPGSGGAFGLAVDAGKKQRNRVGVERGTGSRV
jgi:hypothetical protein